MDHRILRVLDHIETHLHAELTLADLASVGCLSKYHFSRVFSLHLGLGVTAYLRQRRLDRAGELLVTTDLSVQAIAEAVGFGSMSNFQTAFHAHHDCSPTALRKAQLRKKTVEVRNRSRAEGPEKGHPAFSTFFRRTMEMNLREVSLPDLDVAYIRAQGSYLDTGPLWQRLLAWAGPQGMVPPRCQALGISYDQPEVDDDHKTYDACLVLPPDAPRDDPAVQYRTVAGGTFLVYAFYDWPQRLGLVYKEVVTEYLPLSPYDLDDRDFLEMVNNDPAQDPEGRVKVDLYVPVRNPGFETSR